MNFLKVFELIPETVKGVGSIFKATDKGVLSSRRTISGAIVAFALTYMSTNGVTWEGLALLGIGVLPVALLSLERSKKE